MAQHLLSVHDLLGGDAGNGKHGKSPVLQLLSLDPLLFSGLLGVPAKGVPAKVTRLDIVPKASSALQALGLGTGLPFSEDVVGLNEGAAQDEEFAKLGELLVQQVEVADGGAINAKGVLQQLLSQQANRGEHANTAVLDLSLAVLAERGSVLANGQTNGVEEASRGDSTGQASRVLWEGIERSVHQQRAADGDAAHWSKRY